MKQKLLFPLLATTLFTLTSSNLFAVDKWPDTGQKTCYDSVGGVVNCDGSEGFAGQDGAYNGIVRSYDTSSEPGTVIDNVTMLQWDNYPSGAPAVPESFAAAQNYIINLNNTNYLGYNDWRLPTAKELATLIDSGEQPTWDFKSGIYGVLTMPTNTDYLVPPGVGNPINDAIFWSITVSPPNPATHMVIRYKQGVVNDGITGHPFNDTAYARAVRDYAGSAVPEFDDRGDGTIQDQRTGLIWQHATASTTYKWGGGSADDGVCTEGGEEAQVDALCYCENLSLGGYTDWRLPNRNELQSLVDYSRVPTIYPIFSDTNLTYYWTSTTGARWNVSGYYENNAAVAINFDRGFTLAAIYKISDYSVRCVRGGMEESSNMFIFMPAILNGALK